MSPQNCFFAWGIWASTMVLGLIIIIIIIIIIAMTMFMVLSS